MHNMNPAKNLADLTAKRDSLKDRVMAAHAEGNIEETQRLMQECFDVQGEITQIEVNAAYEALTPAERRANAEADFMQRRAVNRYAKRQKLDAEGRPVVR